MSLMMPVPLPESKLSEEIRKKALDAGLVLMGVADLRDPAHFPGQDDQLIAAYPRVIAMAILFPPASVAELKDGPSHTYVHHYRMVNSILDETAIIISNHLTALGYQSYPVPASQRTSKSRMGGIFEHRPAALAAGLGYLGRNNLVMSQKFGSCIRLVSILTNAPLSANSEAAENRCGNCTICVDNCPARAITIDETGKSNFDATECDQYQQWVRDRFGKRVCGKCIAFCPKTPHSR